MANNSIRGRFRRLYDEVEENLSERSKEILNELYRSGVKDFHVYRNNILENLNREYEGIASELATEYGMSVQELKSKMVCDRWNQYSIAIELLNETVHRIRTKEEMMERDIAFEEYMDSILEDRAALGIDGMFEEDDDEEQGEFVKDFQDEKNNIDEDLHNEIFDKLENKLVEIVKNIEQEMNITGQVIDFIIDLYPICD